MVNELEQLDFNIMGVIVPKINTSLFKGTIDDNIKYKMDDNKKICLLEGETELSSKNISKLELAIQINSDLIVLHDFSRGLNKKELQYFYNLFQRMNKEYHKRIILISRDVNFISKFCDTITIYDKRIIYSTNSIFDGKLYEYIDMPKVVRFITLANNKGAGLSNNIDLNELIKDIYRRKNENKNNI